MNREFVKQKRKRTNPSPSPSLSDSRRRAPRKKFILGSVLVLLLCLGAAALWRFSRQPADKDVYVPRPQGTVTFSKHIAPVIFERCAPCHRPDQPAPFSLLSYADAKKHARQMAEVTQSRIMPPWPPEPGFGAFLDARRLSTEQLGLIQQWVAEGAIEGNPKDLPPAPEFAGGWLLGKPDFVATMTAPYVVPAEGKDIYRNFVVPLPVELTAYVKAIEFNPGNWRAVHHAFVRFDGTRESRRRDELEPEPGFGGLNSPASMPDGHFLTWQPGKLPSPPNEGLAWRLEKNTDSVLQFHLRPTGKPEPVQASVAFYFSSRPPANRTAKVALTSMTIDIPPGASNHVVEDQFTLPVDAQITAVLPHAHFLARTAEGWVTRPDGSTEQLLRIKNWDFDWQGDYRYARPAWFPKGSTLFMRWTYDNSTNNPRNPHHPPQRVVYGPQSTDEMAELSFQLIARDTNALAVLMQAHEMKKAEHSMANDEFRLRLNPRDAEAHAGLGLARYSQGRMSEAWKHFRRAIEFQPDYDDGHYYLGLWHRRQGQTQSAVEEFQTALRLNPQHSKAHGNLGIIFMEQGNLSQAEQHFRRALELNPDDTIARASLNEIRQKTSK